MASDLLIFNKDPVFLRKVADFRDEIRDKGVTFRLKARTQAEELLKTSWMLIHDPVVSPAVKADLIKSTVKWAGLEPKGDIGADIGTGGVKITINLGARSLGQRLSSTQRRRRSRQTPTTATQIEFLGPLEAKQAETELATRGVSFRTRITNTKKRGLRYIVEVFSG